MGQEMMLEGTTYKKSLHTFKGIYLIVNQILCSKKLECKLCRKKKKSNSSNSNIRVKTERNKVTRSLEGFRK